MSEPRLSWCAKNQFGDRKPLTYGTFMTARSEGEG